MKFLPLPFAGAFVIQLEPYADERGTFTRLFCWDEIKKIRHHKQIVQINQSLTKEKGAVRGMHFQYQPKSEIKMVKCLRGSALDVIIDLRSTSATLLNWHGELLSAENQKIIYIPEGFAHGFQTLEKNTELLYLHTEFYDPKCEGGIRFNDPVININWPLEVAEISQKDLSYSLLSQDFKGITLS
jgi:dTDP-4-dehydrorhamnose 3,5-epimerase